MFSPDPTVRAAHATRGPATISGGSYNKFTIVFALTEGCTSATAAAIEIESALTQTAAPLGPTTLRPTQDTIAGAPSAYFAYTGATLISGTVTLDSASDYFRGSLAAQVTLSGAATDVTATFNAPLCP